MALKLSVLDNAGSWGPTADAVPKKYLEIPFAPFNKGERLGRACDWYNQKNAGRFTQKFGATNSAFDFTWDENEGFELVDYDSSRSQKYGRRWQRTNWHPRKVQNDRNRHKQNSRQWKKNNRPVKKKKWRAYQPYQQRQERIRTPSIDIQATWTLQDEEDLSALGKAKFFLDEDAQTLLRCGAVCAYDKAFDRINTATERVLDRYDVSSRLRPTASEDPHLKDFAAKKAGTIFATDSVLALLMACPRSVYPWDIVVTKANGVLFFDKREGSIVDQVTVGETAMNPPDEESADAINSKDNLTREATQINASFVQQIVDRAQPQVRFDSPDPFAKEGAESTAATSKAAPKGYLYRKWDLDDGHVLIARCEVDGYVRGPKGDTEILTFNALNEFDPKAGMDWRRTIDAQGGAVLAAELKSNTNKLAQWTVRAVLAGAEKMVLGFVSRTRPKDSNVHSILAVQSYKTTEFAKQTGVLRSNMWGIMKELAERFFALSDGTYVLMRDPNKASVRVFKVPAAALEKKPAPVEQML